MMALDRDCRYPATNANIGTLSNMTNRSVLASKEMCASCGKCCVSFRLWAPNDVTARLAMLHVDGKTIASLPDQHDAELIEIHAPCMEYDAERKSCKIF